MSYLRHLGHALSIICLAYASLATGQVPAVVDSLQPPTWVDRDSGRVPLAPGMQIGANDRVRTGGLGKVIIRLAEGSDVKLGEDVELEVGTLEPAATDNNSVFTGAINVLKGAFRFTTALIGLDQRRRIDIRVGTATLGIRGTDVWGKATPDRDFVVLLDGSVELSRPDEPAVSMSKPFTIYDAPRGKPSKPVSSVNLAELEKWAQETELESGKGVINADGPYRVYLASFQTERRALRLRKQLRDRGYAVELFPAEPDANGRSRIRLGIDGFASFIDANFFRKVAAERLGIQDAWLIRR